MKCSSARISDWIEKFASFTDPNQLGFTRFSYTKEDVAARRFLIQEMKSLNLEVWMDHVGNIFGRRLGNGRKQKPIVVGSHLDTVQSGGKYDGISGVITGLEVVRLLNEHQIQLDAPIEVIAYAEEEGGRFGSAFIGSKWLAGEIQRKDLDDYHDGEENTIASECSKLDVLNEEVKRCERRKIDPQATFELHIEQGPVLESKGNILGVVDTITGSSAYQVIIKGQANHAGTIPMDMRKDAFVAVSEISLALNGLAKEQAIHTVGTIGFVEVKPNAYNIIPGQVEFSMDIRSLDQTCMEQVTSQMKEVIKRVAEDSGLEFTIRTKHNQPVVSLSEPLVSALSTSAEKRNYKYITMGSGAGHDTLVMARMAPSAMVFVPSKAGRSHCPEEFTQPEEIAKGSDLILDAILQIQSY
jgi:allantoate deiminase